MTFLSITNKYRCLWNSSFIETHDRYMWGPSSSYNFVRLPGDFYDIAGEGDVCLLFQKDKVLLASDSKQDLLAQFKPSGIVTSSVIVSKYQNSCEAVFTMAGDKRVYYVSFDDDGRSNTDKIVIKPVNANFNRDSAFSACKFSSDDGNDCHYISSNGTLIRLNSYRTNSPRLKKVDGIQLEDKWKINELLQGYPDLMERTRFIKDRTIAEDDDLFNKKTIILGNNRKLTTPFPRDL